MISFYKKAIPITFGLIFSLLALALLVESMDGYDSDKKYEFIICALIGFPTLFFGIKKVSE